MAEEERNEQQSEETPAEETPEQAPEAEAAEGKPAAEGASDAAEDVEAPAAADAEESSADEAGGGEDASSDEGGGEDASSDAGEDELEGLDWKARQRLERSRRPAEARPQTSPSDRAAARAERRADTRKVRASYRRKRREKHEGGTGTAPAERDSVARKIRQGTVVSDRADKTITVRIDVARRHPVYEKIVRSSNTLAAHDERNEAGEGDLVRIVETRPISRSKRWRLVEILERAK